MLRKAVQRTVNFIAGGWGVLVQVIFGLVIALLVSEYDPLDLGLSEGLSVAAYTALFTFLLLLLVLMFNLAIVYGEKSRLDSLKALADLRIEGVRLRNEGTGIGDILVAKRWMEKYDDWDERTIASISRLISETEGKLFTVVNRFTFTCGVLHTAIPTHNRKYNVLEEKLARLENLQEKYGKEKSNG